MGDCMIPRWKIGIILGILVMLSLSFLFLYGLFPTLVLIVVMPFLFLSISLLITKSVSVRWKIVIVVFLIFVGAVAWLYLSHGFIAPPTSPGIDVQLDSEKVNNTYVVTVTDVHLDDKIYYPDGEEFHGDPMLLKYYGYAVSYSGGYVYGDVVDILEKNGSVTFHDNDNDGRVSVGDEFIIDENISNAASFFRLRWKPFGDIAGTPLGG